jgi:hypothetical protein
MKIINKINTEQSEKYNKTIHYENIIKQIYDE